jgi:hypothetical protein
VLRKPNTREVVSVLSMPNTRDCMPDTSDCVLSMPNTRDCMPNKRVLHMPKTRDCMPDTSNCVLSMPNTRETACLTLERLHA